MVNWCLIYELFSGELPFQNDDKYDVDQLDFSNFPSKVQNFLRRLLVIDPCKRCSIFDLLGTINSSNFDDKLDPYVFQPTSCFLQRDQHLLLQDLQSSNINSSKVLYSLLSHRLFNSVEHFGLEHSKSLCSIPIPSFTSLEKKLRSFHICNLKDFYGKLKNYLLIRGFCFGSQIRESMSTILNQAGTDISIQFDFHCDSDFIEVNVDVTSLNEKTVLDLFQDLNLF